MGLFGKKQVVGLAESGIGLIARGVSLWGTKSDNEPQNVPLQNQYDNAYLNFPIVAASIDITAEQVVQDFHFEGPDKEWLAQWADKVNLDQALFTITKHCLKNGNMWVEFPSEFEMNFVDPKTMTTHRKRTGELIGFSQHIDGKDTALWGTTGDKNLNSRYEKQAPFKNMVQFSFNKLAGDKYGTPITHSVLPLLRLKDQIESDLKVIVRRYAAPIIDVAVGDENHMPKSADITTIKGELQDIYADTEYVHNYLTKFSVLGFEGKALNVDYILKHLDLNIAAGLQTPADLLGISQSNKSEAEVKLRSFGRHIKSIQRAIKIELEDKVIVGILGFSADNKLVWDAAEEREAEIFVDQVRGLVTDGIISPQKANGLLNPKFHEELPKEYSKPLKPAASTFQDQRPFQKGADAVNDNPTDPNIKQKDGESGGRRVKTDRQIPVGA